MSDTTDSILNALHSSPHSSQKDNRHSPVAPLAPLEFLQSQRRGSITDPSLHAALTNSSLKSSASNRQLQISPSLPSSQSNHDPNQNNSMSDPRPSSPYVFGDATSHSAESNIQLRKLLRSPSLEHHDPQLTSPMSHPDTAETNISNENGTQDSAKPQSGVMTSDVDRISQQTADRRNNREGHHFNYSMRRHSIAAAQEIHGQPTAHTPHGTKRKMSGDRNGFAPVGEEIDPQLVGPGVPSVMEVDPEAPAPKRRGSAIDSRGLAQLSINERSTPWWSSGRRDSTSSLLSGNSTMGNYSPGAAGDGRLPGGMAAFAWPTNPQPVDPSAAPGVQNPSDPSVGMTRTFDPTIPMAMMSPGFSQDRRMSVPSALPSGQTRVLRSRSRPPSRQKQNGVTSTTTPSTNQEEAASNPPATTATKSVKESSTPYSRSPELRISHKLAERKRRKEMKDLFDELRDQLPADRGMKASKWEILSKAIDFVTQLKQSHQDMIREIEMLRHELDAIRQGIPPFPGGPPPHAVVYTQGPPVPGQYPPPPPGVLQHQPPPQPHPPLSRPSSSQNTFPPGAGPPTPNGAVERIEAPQP